MPAAAAFIAEPWQIASDGEEEQRARGEPAVEDAGEGALLRVQPARAGGHRAHGDGEKRKTPAFRFGFRGEPAEAVNDRQRGSVRERSRTPAQREISAERRRDQHPWRFGVERRRTIALGEIAERDEDEANECCARRTPSGSQREGGDAGAVGGARGSPAMSKIWPVSPIEAANTSAAT